MHREQTNFSIDIASLQRLFELSRDMICIANQQGNFVHINPGWSRLLGYEPAELLSRPFLDRVHQDDKKPTLDVLQRLHIEGNIIDFENRYICKNGEIKWFLWSASYEAEHGLYFAIGKDITERKQHELNLRNSSALLKAIQQVQTQYITDVDPREIFENLLNKILSLTGSEYGFIGEVLHTEESNPYLKTYAITNIAWDDASHKFYDERTPQGLEFHNLKSLFGEVLVSGEVVLSNDPHNAPCSGGLPPGHPTINAFLGMPFYSGKEMIGMVGIANRKGGYDQALVDFLKPVLISCANIISALRTDMLRRTAIDQRESRDTLIRAILESAVDGIITINDTGIVNSFNAAAEKIFGYQPEEVIGQNISMLMPSPYQELHDNYLKNYLSTGQRKVIGIGREVLGLRKDGTTFPLDLAVSEMWIDHTRMFTGIVRDITERKQMERMKDEFVSTVSHELRTPLTSIRGSLGLVAGGVLGELNDKGKELMQIAVNNCDRLVRLINDILDIQKMESGRMEFIFDCHEITPIIERCIESNEAYAAQHGIKIKLNNRTSNVWAKCDPDRLDQVITNLLSNAVKFSPKEATVDVVIEYQHDRVTIEVQDQGEGVPANFVPHLFERFAMADASDIRKVPGTGLGLSICKAIIERHGGDIGYTDCVPHGACLFIKLPAWQKL